MGERKLDVRVILEDPTSTPPKFTLDCPELPRWKNEKNDFEFKNEGEDDDGFLLRFILQGNAHGYRFPDNELQALYSAKGPDCPTSPGQWPQFYAREVKPGNKILVVRNLNQAGRGGQFAYTLRVTKSPHDDERPEEEYLNLDPGGFNGNGHGRKNISAATFVLAIAVGVVSALVTVFSLIGLRIIQ